MENRAQGENLSKKGLRDLKYQGKIEKRERRAEGLRVRRYIIWGGVLIVLILAVWGVFVTVSKNTMLPGVSKPEPISTSDWSRGSKDARVSIVEYSDFQCPACATFSDFANRLVRDYGDKILFTYRYFPLISIHKTAIISGTAAEAAGNQGKFWEMGDKLFQNQSSWSDKPNVRDIFIGYAGELGLDIEKFKVDINSKELENKINEAYKKATTMGLNYTPSVFINGELVKNLVSYEEFKTIIESAIKANP